MPITIKHQSDSSQVAVTLTGKLTRDDYEQSLPEFERLFDGHGKLNLLVHMIDFHGWELSAIWEDIKFDTKHYDDVGRIAFVGDRTWEAWMARICRPFTTAEVSYFDASERDLAEAWVREHEFAPSS